MFGTLVAVLALVLPLAYVLRELLAPSPPQPGSPSEKMSSGKSVMQPPREDIAPPKDDPITLEQLRSYDGSDPSRPIYVAIKGASASHDLRDRCSSRVAQAQSLT